ncbi:MAG: AMP-binding protein [Planctomycetes bacterium]|nr:AMP-binding protein [Planctomycetota bacterium]
MQRTSFDGTMIDVLVSQAAEQPDGIAYAFVDDRDGTTEITFSELDRRARAIAARLQLELKPGDRALLVYPAGLDFIAAFFGCLYAGIVAVPATYPKPKRPLPRLNRIAADCDAHVALSTSQTLATLDPNLLSADAATSLWIATDQLHDALTDHWERPNDHEHDLAFLQYTSGSTSDPKGVMVSHANLLNNLECIRQSFGIGEMEEDRVSSTGVFWLPAYHDMGLIGGVLMPLYMGGRSILMSPTAFLQRPMRWLQTIHKYHATVSGAPNFAYEYCVRRTTPDERATLDLSHWRLAFCGAEPIRVETLHHFAEAFRVAGFHSKAFYPCYGLAEVTLLAAGPDFRDEPTVLAVNRPALAEHRVVPTCGEPAEMVHRLVGCGQAMPDHRLVIVSPETGLECPEGEVGEILVQGPSVTQGYWNRPEETESDFGARVEGHEGRFLRTGDLGFFREGELFVTGRVKDVIIIRGRNHYPQDIEQSAEEAHPAVLPGAAFALVHGDDERLGVVHQIDRQYRGSDHQQIVQAIRRAIVEQHELDPCAIVLIRQTSLPITSSGKVQRNLCRDQYLAGELKVVHSWTNPAYGRTEVAEAEMPSSTNGRVDVQLHGEGVAWRRNGESATKAAPDAPVASGASIPHPSKTHRKRRSTSPVGGVAASVALDRTAEQIETWLLGWLVARLGLDVAEMSRDRPFAELGVDSLAAVELSAELEREFGVPLPPIVAWNYPTPAALARYLAEQSTGGGATAEAAQTAYDLNDASASSVNGSDNDAELAALLAEIENLSDEDAARLLAEEQRQR